jgi:hypothetical protein
MAAPALPVPSIIPVTVAKASELHIIQVVKDLLRVTLKP